MTDPNAPRLIAPAAFCAALLCSGAALAHEGHHDEEAPATAVPQGHAAADTPQLELVAERRGADVLLYLDDYATNAPLDGLQVSVRSGAQLLQAAPAGEGTYRIPGDLIDAAKDQSLAVEVHGAGVEAQLQAVLPAAAAENAVPPVDATAGHGRIAAVALGVIMLAGLMWALLRRRRGAA